MSRATFSVLLRQPGSLLRSGAEGARSSRTAVPGSSAALCAPLHAVRSSRPPACPAVCSITCQAPTPLWRKLPARYWANLSARSARYCASLSARSARYWATFSARSGGGGWLARRPDRAERLAARGGLALAATWFTTLTVQSECDQVDFETLLKNRLVEADQQQTGWERLQVMYSLDEVGGLTPELEQVGNIGVAGLLIGGALGGVMNGRVAMATFLERNKATVFETPLVAKRALQDRVVIGMFRGFFILGWRAALFSSAFGLVATSLQVYTNQISALHFVCAGCVSGALYKVTMGLRGMVAGAVAGSLLGLVGGGAISLLCHVAGVTQSDLRYQQYLWKYQQQLRQQERARLLRQKRQDQAEQDLQHESRKQELPPVLPSFGQVRTDDNAVSGQMAPAEVQTPGPVKPVTTAAAEDTAVPAR